MPQISIILPLYNGEKFIRHTLSGIRAQTFRDWELLVMDDGSSDSSFTIALQEAAKDSRIRVFHRPNGGISSARNYGITHAAGRYIAFADQDDTVSRNWLQALYRGMDGTADLVVGGKKLEVLDAAGKAVRCRICRYKDTVLETREELDAFLFHQENDASSLHVWNCLYKKELLDVYGIRFDENLTMGMEDVLFNICYGYRCRSIRKIPQVVYTYTQRIGISTSTRYNPELVREYAHRMNAIAGLFGFPKQSEAYEMYKDYALREMCNLYFRSSGTDSRKLLAGLRDAYVQCVPKKSFFRKRHLGKGIYGRSMLRETLYAIADSLLRKKRYLLPGLIKSGISQRRSRHGCEQIG